ncbi:MAG: SPASM domain-containing protein [Saprospiraceae bacterium]
MGRSGTFYCSTHRLGSLQQDSFAEIWKGGAYQDFRKLLLKGRDQIEICTNCTEGCKVWG